MSRSELINLSALKAAALIRRKKLSPVEYMDAVLAQVDALEPKVNAFITLTADSARAQARKAEQAVMDGAPLGPLHGVPTGIKDLLPTKGVKTTFGSKAFADNVPDHDDILVTRLNAAGAIMIGKTTTPEFGIKGQTDAPLYGVTRNPWDLSRTSGGSSGGAAASVAAGMGPISLGSDGAGSVRIPAACCGLVGMKGTTGTVPYQQARESLGNPVMAGPLTRTVADAVLMQSVMAGPDPMDPWTDHAGPITLLSPKLLSQDLSGIRIGYLSRCANKVVASDVEAATLKALKSFEAMGAYVEEVKTPIDWMVQQQRVLYTSSIRTFLGPLVEKWGPQLDPVLIAYIEAGAPWSITDYMRAVVAKTELLRAVQRLFGQYDYLVSPTLTRTALDANYDSAKGTVEIDGEQVGSTQAGWTAYMYPFNLSGNPALTVPSGFGDDSLPLGVQIIGPRHADGDVFRLGALLETANPWADKWPEIVG
jgi:aspartyl-tRNA(Asn)/glutamyl-tRNA(Gln) amidotransferase subunit A